MPWTKSLLEFPSYVSGLLHRQGIALLLPATTESTRLRHTEVTIELQRVAGVSVATNTLAGNVEIATSSYRNKVNGMLINSIPSTHPRLANQIPDLRRKASSSCWRPIDLTGPEQNKTTRPDNPIGTPALPPDQHLVTRKGPPCENNSC